MQEVLRGKSKSLAFKRKILLLHTSAKSRHQESKLPFCEFRWIGPYLVENVLPNKNYIVRKLKIDKTQILHRIRLRKYNHGKSPGDNYLEAQWKLDDNIVVPQDDLYTHACEAEFGGHLFDNPIIYTDPNANNFDESYTQGPDTVTLPRSYFHDSSDGQNRETFPTSDPPLLHASNPKSLGQSQDIETATALGHDDSSKQLSESNTDNEGAYEFIQQPPSWQSATLQRLISSSVLQKLFARRTLSI